MNLKEEHKNLGLLDKSYYYFKEKRMGLCPMMKITFTKTVELKDVEYAVGKMYQRYLHLRLKIVETEDDFHYEENNKPFIITNEPYYQDKILGKETNDYPWLVSYKDNYVTFVYFHSLFDGIGVLEVRKTFLYYYFESQGITPAKKHDIKTLNDDVDALLDKEMEYGLEPYIRRDISPLPEKKLRHSDRVASKFMDQDDRKTKTYSFTLQMNSVLPVLKKFETTPFALLLPILIRSIRYLFTEEKPIINTSTIANLRSYTRSGTLRNSLSQAYMDYIPEEMDELPFNKLSTVYRTLLDVKLNENNVLSNITRIHDIYARLEGVKPLAKRMAYMNDNFDSKGNTSMRFTYSARLVLPEEYSDKIAYIQSFVETTADALMVNALSWKDSMTLIISSRFNDDSFNDNIMTYFDELGIKYVFEKLEDLASIKYVN